MCSITTFSIVTPDGWCFVDTKDTISRNHDWILFARSGGTHDSVTCDRRKVLWSLWTTPTLSQDLNPVAIFFFHCGRTIEGEKRRSSKMDDAHNKIMMFYCSSSSRPLSTLLSRDVEWEPSKCDRFLPSSCRSFSESANRDEDDRWWRGECPLTRCSIVVVRYKNLSHI